VGQVAAAMALGVSLTTFRRLEAFPVVSERHRRRYRKLLAVFVWLSQGADVSAHVTATTDQEKAA
jgi:hypothetical protein